MVEVLKKLKSTCWTGWPETTVNPILFFKKNYLKSVVNKGASNEDYNLWT